MHHIISTPVASIPVLSLHAVWARDTNWVLLIKGLSTQPFVRCSVRFQLLLHHSENPATCDCGRWQIYQQPTKPQLWTPRWLIKGPERLHVLHIMFTVYVCVLEHDGLCAVSEMFFLDKTLNLLWVKHRILEILLHETCQGIKHIKYQHKKYQSRSEASLQKHQYWAAKSHTGQSLDLALQTGWMKSDVLNFLFWEERKWQRETIFTVLNPASAFALCQWHFNQTEVTRPNISFLSFQTTGLHGTKNTASSSINIKV